jgi:hypothetical protein
MLYHLSHTPSPLFLRQGLLNFSQSGLELLLLLPKELGCWQACPSSSRTRDLIISHQSLMSLSSKDGEKGFEENKHFPITLVSVLFNIRKLIRYELKEKATFLLLKLSSLDMMCTVTCNKLNIL